MHKGKNSSIVKLLSCSSQRAGEQEHPGVTLAADRKVLSKLILLNLKA